MAKPTSEIQSRKHPNDFSTEFVNCLTVETSRDFAILSRCCCRCRCLSGFTGKNCTKNIDDCIGQCQHGALCIDLVDDYHCSCTPGYSGKNCENDIDECASKPCQNGGECRDLVNAYECVCQVGFTGYQCEIDQSDLCSPNPCRNSAPCFNTQTDYYCHCPEQWQGKNCTEPTPHNPQYDLTNDEQISCGSQGTPCSGRGICTGGKCTCNPGYNGTHCHENINDCRGNPCLNGGTCVDLVNSFQCICREGWSGNLCDQGELEDTKRKIYEIKLGN